MTITDERPSAPHALDMFARQFELMTGTPRERFTLRQVRTQRLGRWVVITVSFRGFPEVTLRISDQWARVVRDGLSRCLPS